MSNPESGQPWPLLRKFYSTLAGGLDKVKIDENFGDKEPCAVCLEKFQVGDEAKRLPCSHVYYSGCIVDRLIKREFTCPTCRRNFRNIIDITFSTTANQEIQEIVKEMEERECLEEVKEYVMDLALRILPHLV
ncbi:hypothetical protein PTKIN_Ptkin17bG0007200 [Pterospermum kingtungense]